MLIRAVFDPQEMPHRARGGVVVATHDEVTFRALSQHLRPAADQDVVLCYAETHYYGALMGTDDANELSVVLTRCSVERDARSVAAAAQRLWRPRLVLVAHNDALGRVGAVGDVIIAAQVAHMTVRACDAAGYCVDDKGVRVDDHKQAGRVGKLDVVATMRSAHHIQVSMYLKGVRSQHTLVGAHAAIDASHDTLWEWFKCHTQRMEEVWCLVDGRAGVWMALLGRRVEPELQLAERPEVMLICGLSALMNRGRPASDATRALCATKIAEVIREMIAQHMIRP